MEDIFCGEIYKMHIAEKRLGNLHQSSYSIGIDGVK